MFVASISRGRTIREFIVASLLVPPLLTFVWFSVFGGAAFHVELAGPGGMATQVAEDVSTGLFKLYAHYPLTPVLSLLTVVLLGVFFVTSADSATYVLAMMTTHGDPTPPASKKIVWGLTVSATACILLYSGGLEALQRMAIAAALPFTAIMLLLCRSLLKGLNYEMKETRMKCDPEMEAAE
jgi:glycine betaine transporter